MNDSFHEPPRAPAPTASVAAARLRTLAADSGLPYVAFTQVADLPEHRLYERWLQAEQNGEMFYLAADAAVRHNPAALLAQARTVVCAALPYFHPEPLEVGGGLRGQIARYARGEDYHLVLRGRLNQLAARIAQEIGRPVAYRTCVDSAPVLERALGSRAGLGFVGKNTLLISPGVGSFTVLGELLLEVDVVPGAPDDRLDRADQADRSERPRCGACDLCQVACPTGALTADYVLDARRCISYLTIELAGPIPIELRPLCGAWIFGCDVCQDVCPWNAAGRPGDPEVGRRAGPRLPVAAPGEDPLRHARPQLVEILGLGAAQFRRYVKRTALRRVDRGQLLRNAAVALGNIGGAAEVPALARALLDVPLVRRHAAWALGEIGRRQPGCEGRVRELLGAAARSEPDPEVRAEVVAALARLPPVGAEPVQDDL